jgi:two-component system NtrC family sensor kinase
MTNKAKVLVIDDEQPIAELIAYSLKNNGYQVEIAFDGEAGLAKARAEKFDLVITDIQMPGMDGITALGELKKLDPEIEVIIATGHGDMSTAIQSLRKGAFDYVHKPFDIKDLVGVVGRALEKRKFNDISKAIFSTIKPDELPRIIIDSATRVLKADEALLALNGRDGRLFVAVSDGLDSEAERASRLEFCSRMREHFGGDGARGAALVENPSADARFAGVPDLSEVKSSLLLPIMEENRLAGVIGINRRGGGEGFGENDLQRAKLFGSLVNLALRNANLYRQLQETQGQLVQAEKMSALGQLAGGLAHEINNPLSGILGLTQLVLETTPPDTQNFQDLKDIEKAVFRCKKIITSLLSFARQEKTRVEQVSVNEVIEETLTLCARQMELRRVRMERSFAQGLPLVSADFQQLMQVFLNLLTNARDAMPDGGAITVSTRKSGPWVEVSIEDTGAGIPEEILGRIFDPFFTTKPAGQGTGLGLSVCLGIIHKHNGSISAHSAPGKGSAFTVRLPAL